MSLAYQPLKGLTVVSLEQAVAAPLLSAKLCDAGARVIKIERDAGDFARGYDDAVHGLSSYFVWLNRGKESLVADIKRPEDAALLTRILASADVFIQNLAPGAAARAGFGSAALRARHPRLITVDISGYGERGPYSQMKAYDLLVQAETGLAQITGHPAGPGRVGVSISDIACGLTAYGAVLEALIARGRTGLGQGLETSLFAATADWINVPLLYFEGSGKTPQRVGLGHPSIAPYSAFATKDGDQVIISIQNEREWAQFCVAFLGEPGLAVDPRFGSNNARVAHRGDLDRHIGDAFANLTRAEAIARLQHANTAYGFVNDLAAVARHPALRRTEVETPGGPVNMICPPVINTAGDRVLGPVPALGQHTAAIQREFAVGGAA